MYIALYQSAAQVIFVISSTRKKALHNFFIQYPHIRGTNVEVFKIEQDKGYVK